MQRDKAWQISQRIETEYDAFEDYAERFDKAFSDVKFFLLQIAEMKRALQSIVDTEADGMKDNYYKVSFMAQTARNALT